MLPCVAASRLQHRFTPTVISESARTYSLLRKDSHAIYSDRAIVVLDKPPGLDTQLDKDAHPLRNILTDLKTETTQGYELPHPHPVHRLDKGTTGVLICGRTKSAVSDLHTQFRNRDVEKEYLALVRGGRAALSQLGGSMVYYWNKRNGYINVSDVRQSPKDKLAISFWELVGTSPVAPLSLVLLRPHTGYKHQLRVQLSHMGAPILGDTRYSADVHSSISNVLDSSNEALYLHALSASFYRYRKLIKPRRFRLKVVAPVPNYFRETCDAFKISLDQRYVTGGVYVDDEHVKSGEVEGVDGHWLR